MSVFDADNFMNTQYSEANATKIIPCPAGEYNAVIADIKSRVIEKTGQVILSLSWEIDDAKAREITGRPKLTVRQDIFLDLNEQGGLIFGEGKNVGLGRVRAAVNQNAAGQPWSPGMLKGKAARVKVTHRPDKDTGDIYDQIGAVSALK